MPIKTTEAGKAWCPARIEALREHFRLGLTAAQSAILLGTSKNAVISKRRRLGLVHERTDHRSLAIGVAETAAPIYRPRRISIRLTPPQFSCEPLPEMDFPPPPGARPVTLARRRCGQCAWPLGPAEQPADFRTLFCGAPVARGGYCAAHATVAFLSVERADG